MRLVQKGGIPFFQFSHLAACPELRHAVFTRRGGVSPPPFDSLNAGHGVGDRQDRVTANRKIIAGLFASDGLTTVRQVHGTGVVVPEQVPAPAGGGPPAADALVSGRRGRPLMIQVADCQPVLLYDPVRRVAAAVHSGWRGSVKNILGRTVAAMTRHFASRPADILAGIGPSLGPCCAEFVNYETEIPRPLWRYKDTRHHFDFWAMSADQLREAGVPARHIRVSGMCTRCNGGLFFSYRGQKRTGRLAAVIGLR